MPRSLRPSELLVWAIPLVFVVASWVAAAGFPYYLDSNETFLSYVHARNLELWNPAEYGWLTAEATDPLRASTEDVYSHNPNGPRYLHYALLRLGIRDISQHVLILGLLGTGLTVWLLTRTFASRGLLVVALAVVLDYVGFLAWTVNTYRVWTFVLYFGLVLAVTRNRPVWVGLLTFLLFQVEYGMALFMGVMATVLALMLHGWGARRLILVSAAGAALSLAVFAGQVLAYYGLDGFVSELAATYARRGTAGEAAGPATFAYQAWHGLYELAISIARDAYSRPVLLVTVAGIGIAVLMLRRPTSTETERYIAAVTVATSAGALATSTLLYGYFVGGFVQSLLPFSVFLIAPTIGVVALELRRLLALRWGSPYLGTLAGGLALLPLVLSSVAHYEPPVAVDLFRMLQSDLRGRPVVAPFLGPALAGPELAFALTGGRAAATSDIEVTAGDTVRLADLRDADGNLTYVCLDTLYLRQRNKVGAFSVCDIAAERLATRGHDITASGLGWNVVRVSANEPAAADDRTGRIDSLAGRP